MQMEMLFIGSTRPGTSHGHRTRGLRAWRALALVGVLALAAGCDDTPTALEPGASTTGDVAGVVRVAATSAPIAGAVVTIGEASATTGQDGRYHFVDLPAGAITIRVSATGFADLESHTSIPDYPVTRDLALERIETFEFGDYALYAPGDARTIRAVLVTLGGPDTRGFANGSVFGAPVPEVETALGDLGARFRALAEDRELAVLGTSLMAMPTSATSDQAIADALRQAAILSARPELAEAPVLLYGISGGAPEAAGFAARNPGRVAGLFLKVPESIDPGLAGAALDVPAYMVMAELDAFVDNGALGDAFRTIRRAGGLWAAVMERNVPHHSLSAPQRTFTLDWMDTILELRIPRGVGGELKPIDTSGSWLGDPVSGSAAPWAEFVHDVSTASWLPTEETAEQWRAFGAVRGPTGAVVLVEWSALTVSVGRWADVNSRAFDGDGKRIQSPVGFTFSLDKPGVVEFVNDNLCGSDCSYFYVHALSPGTATVTVEYGGAAASTEFTVVPAVGTLIIEPGDVTLAPGDHVILAASIVDAGDNPPQLADRMHWEWWDPEAGWDPTKVANISLVPGSGGLLLEVTALKPGTITFWARFDGYVGPDPDAVPIATVTVE